MNTNDPIEELFRERSNETVGEKPRDLVWKRIESGLKDKEKKEKPISEFISSVWFSAAVFALIAVPYFVLFIENLNSAQNKENSVEFVKTDSPIIEEEKSVQLDTIQTNINSDKSLDTSIEIVKNGKIKEQPVYKVIEGVPGSASYHQAEYPALSSASANATVYSSAPQSMEERTKVLDSIEKQDQFAVAAKSNAIQLNDSLAKKRVVIRGVSKMKNTSDQMKMTVVAASKEVSKEVSQNTSAIQVSPKKTSVKKSEIKYKPFLLTVKSDILRTNFKLLKKSLNKVSFQNKSIVVSFEKVNNTIILTTTEPNIDPTLLGTLEKNKKEIYTYYQNIKK